MIWCSFSHFDAWGCAIIKVSKFSKGTNVALVDYDKPMIPLSGVADMLGAKSRTLRMYEDKGLLPRHEGVEKKLYSINDIEVIAYIHYLASFKRINANGIRYSIELLNMYLSEEQRKAVFGEVEQVLKKEAVMEIETIETLETPLEARDGIQSGEL